MLFKGLKTRVCVKKQFMKKSLNNIALPFLCVFFLVNKLSIVFHRQLTKFTANAPVLVVGFPAIFVNKTTHFIVQNEVFAGSGTAHKRQGWQFFHQLPVLHFWYESLQSRPVYKAIEKSCIEAVVDMGHCKNDPFARIFKVIDLFDEAGFKQRSVDGNEDLRVFYSLVQDIGNQPYQDWSPFGLLMERL